MPRKDWATILSEAKTLDTAFPERIIGLVSDPILQRLVTVWDSIPLVVSAPESEAPPTARERWHWLWTCVEWKEEDIARSLGESLGVAKRTLHKAVYAHLVYPDGTTNNYAREFLRALIVRQLPKQKLTKKTPPPDDAEPS